MADEQSNGLNRDLLSRILSQVDGPTLAAATCASSDLRGVAHEEKLWEHLCNSTWPSTSGKETQTLISSMGGYAKFFADSFPLLLYKPVQPGVEEQSVSTVFPSDFVSLIDVYYEEKCTFSKVLWGIPGANDGDLQHHSWFSDCPFRIDLLNLKNGTQDDFDYDDDDDDGAAADGGDFPSMFLVEKKERGSVKSCRKLEKNVRLSWVLVNLKKKKAVNLSSWKPLFVQRNWPSEGCFLLRFGCVIPVQGFLPCNSAQCVISVKCRVLRTGGGEGLECLKWRELSMQVEDLEGAHVNGKKSLMVLDRALGCCRSKDHGVVDEGYMKFVREQKDLREKKMRSEWLADRISILCGIAVFFAFCFFIL